MFTFRDLLLGALLPGLAALAVLAALGYRRGTGGRAAALALGAGAALGIAGVQRGLPPLLPGRGGPWLFHLAVAGTAMELAESSGRVRGAVRAGARVLLAGLAAWTFVRSYPGGEAGAAFRVALHAAAILGFWAASAGIAARLPGPAAPGILLVAAGAGNLANALSGSFKLGWLGAGLAAALLASAALAWRAPGRPLAGGGVAVPALVLPVLWFQGYYPAFWIGGFFRNGLPAASLLLLLAAPAAALGAAGRDPGRRRALLAVGSALVLSAAAVVIAWAKSPPFE